MNLNLSKIMDYTVKINVLVIAFVLVFTLSIAEGKSVSGKKSNCSSVVCQEPPNNATCRIAEKEDNIPKPKGKEGQCCPVYKCTDPTTPPPPPSPSKPMPTFSQLMNFPSFFTFSGYSDKNAKPNEKPENTETVSYKNTNPASSMGGGNFFNFVNSVATGSHNSMAYASNSMMTPEQIMKAMEAAF